MNDQTYSANGIETWLTNNDMQRLWNVVMEDGLAENATEDELEEFARVLEAFYDYKVSQGVPVSRSLQ